MASPNPDPISPTLADDIAPPRPGKRATVADTGTTGHSALHTRQFGAHVPDANTSVVDVSGHPESEHAKPVGTVYLGNDHYGREIHVIPQRTARMIDGTEHEYDHEARGMDTQFNAGHLRLQAHVLAANGHTLATNLMGDQRAPSARARGSASYRSAMDRAGHDTKDNTKHDK